MTFNCNRATFDKLAKQLADSHQAVMEAAPTATNGEESGTITHDSVKAEYTWNANVLTVEVTQGGNIVVNHVIHSKVQASIEAIAKGA